MTGRQRGVRTVTSTSLMTDSHAKWLAKSQDEPVGVNMTVSPDDNELHGVVTKHDVVI